MPASCLVADSPRPAGGPARTPRKWLDTAKLHLAPADRLGDAAHVVHGIGRAQERAQERNGRPASRELPIIFFAQHAVGANLADSTPRAACGSVGASASRLDAVMERT